jgi:hypothetical protein
VYAGLICDACDGDTWRKAAQMHVIPLEKIVSSRIVVTQSNQVFERKHTQPFRSGFNVERRRRQGSSKNFLSLLGGSGVK